MKRKPIKGKVPRTDWTAILARHDRGETLAQIGADYGCTAPAISYIVKRAKAERAARQEDAAPSGRENILREKPVARHGGGPRGRLAPKADVVRADRSQAPSAAGGTRRWFDSELHQKISDDIASFLVAFDCAINSGTEENCEILLEASERLMRAAARTRIELARLRAAGTEIEASPEGRGSIVGDALRRRM